MIRHAVALAALSLLACNGCNDGRSPAVAPAGTATPTAAASPPPAGSAPSAGAAGDTIVRADDDGKSFDVARGAGVTFRLASNSGTGYLWIPTQVDAIVLAQQSDRASEAASDMPGGPKADVYRFTAGAAGSTVVEMSLKRPFGSAPPARVIHVTINVR
jgi:predicted secreted protein